MLKQEKPTTRSGLRKLLRMPIACAIVFASALVFSSGAVRAQDTTKHVPPPPPPLPADSVKPAPNQVRFPPPKMTRKPAKPPKAPSHKKKDLPPPPPPVEPVKSH